MKILPSCKNQISGTKIAVFKAKKRKGTRFFYGYAFFPWQKAIYLHAKKLRVKRLQTIIFTEQ